MTLIRNFIRWRIRWLMGIFARFCISEPDDAHSVHRVLCLISGGLGDRLMALPALRLLRQKYRDAWLCVAWLEGGLPPTDSEFDHVFVFSPKDILPKIRLAGRGWDVIYVNATGVYHVLNELCSLVSKAPVRIGPLPSVAYYRYSVYNRPYVIESRKHLTLINCMAIAASECGEYIEYPVKRREWIQGFFKKSQGKRCVALNTSAGKGYAHKRWPLSNFQALIELLSKNSDIEIVLLVYQLEKKDMIPWAENLSVRFAVHQSLEELFQIISGCDLLVTNDSGPAHVAAALQVPVVVIFGPADPRKYGPAVAARRILSPTIECAPCYDHYRPCRDIGCLKEITVESVFHAAESLL